MKKFGVEVENDQYETFTFKNPGGFTAGTYAVEGDWSGGAFLLVAGAVAGKITVEGLSISSTQADKEIMKALVDCGANVATAENKITVAPASLSAFSFDATDCPDLFPPLVALASYCRGTTYIKGVSRLAHKESNRGLALQEEFGKIGVSIEMEEDIMQVHGGGELTGAIVHSHHDHRIAMACAVAGLKSNGAVTIHNAESIRKSFPDFYDILKSVGAQIDILESSFSDAFND
jgi:3-phosphoshikimate 1-carboxyvinyltransferase